MNTDQAVSGILLTIVMIVLATLFSGIMLTGMADLQELNSELLKDHHKTYVKIIFSGKSSPTEAKIWIKNIGETSIAPLTIQKSTLLFGPSENFKIVGRDGESPRWDYLIIDRNGDGRWSPHETLEITVYWGEELPPGDYYVKFSLYSGGEAEGYFKIT